MKILSVVEVCDSQLKAWAADLTEGEKVILAADPQARWAPWDLYLNWLRVMGWEMVGVLGYCGPLDEDRKVLIVVDGVGEPPELPAHG